MRFVALLVFSASALAQPVIHPGGVVNAASFLPADSPGGAIAPGSIFAIFGMGLGPLPEIKAEEFPLRTTLAGVSVRVLHLQKGVSLAAIPVFVSNFQINAILPSNTPVGSVAVTVTYDGLSSAAQTAKVVRSSFGIFARLGAAVVQNFISSEEQPLNSPAQPATPGQTVILWGTGLGPIAGSDAAGPAPGALDVPMELTLGGRPVSIEYRGRSGCCAGVDQVNFRIPADAPTGCAVPLAARVQGGIYSNVATVAVGPIDPSCAGPGSPGGVRRRARVDLIRSTSAAGTQDSAFGLFGFQQQPEFGAGPGPGTCISGGGAVAGIAVALDAGPLLTLEGPQGARQIPRGPGGAYQLLAGPGAGSLFLGPGVYTLSAPGGADVGPFRASLAAPAAPNWTTTSGDRNRGLTLAWSGGGPPNSVLGISARPGFFCAAALAAGSITVPPAIAANLPAVLEITLSAGSSATFAAEGLDAGVFSYTHFNTGFFNFGEPPLAASPVRLPNGQTILAELATSASERQRGLMQRAELAVDRGMLFLHDRQDRYPFWMFGTLIPLDILWMDRDRRIVFISANTPPCPSPDSRNCPLYGGAELAQ